jgi:hypothetical protein
MKDVRLHRVIKEIQFKLETMIWDLNYGGCGIFALIMYAYMKKYGFDCKIVFYSNGRDKKKYEQFFNEVFNGNFKNANLLSATHILIEYEDLFFDGHQFQNKDVDFEKTGEYSLKELSIALKFGDWNPRFDRKKHTKKIEYIIKSEFEKVFKYTVTKLSLNS